MDRDELIGYCLGKPGAEETYPWGEEELVAKVGGKGFAFIGLEAARSASSAAATPPRPPSGGTAIPAPSR